MQTRTDIKYLVPSGRYFRHLNSKQVAVSIPGMAVKSTCIKLKRRAFCPEHTFLVSAGGFISSAGYKKMLKTAGFSLRCLTAVPFINN